MRKVLKAFGILLCAVALGAVAGLSMYAVTKYTGVLDAYKNALNIPKQEPDIQNQEPQEKEPKVKIGSDEATVTYFSDNDVSNIVEKTMPSVVAITGKTEYETYDMFGYFFGGGGTQTYEGESSGSGIIIGEDDDEYMIATNNHVVAGTKELVITFANESTAPASVKGKDAEKDVAVISVKKEDLDKEAAEYIKVANIGDSESLKIGQGVVAIGNALGKGLSVTTGVVSALNRQVEAEGGTAEGLIQTDAAINPGNSGGALLNMSGELIGINESKYSSTGVEGMGFAIPISNVMDILEDFSEREVREAVPEEEQGFLGIQGQNIDSSTAQMYDMPEGIYVYKIVEGVPAENSELQEKDVIVKFDGQSLRTMEELQEILKGYKAGERVIVTVKRLEDAEYVEKEIEIELATRNQLQTTKS